MATLCADVRNLSIARRGRLVQHGLTFSMQGGLGYWLRGSNGCGKTTLLRTLAGILPPAKGQLSVHVPVIYVADRPALKPQLTVSEHLAFWAALCGASQAGVQAALTDWQLTPLKARLAGMLSLGQQARLSLARLSFMPAPCLWLLDEPFSALDSSMRALLSQKLEAHCKQGGCAVVTSHGDISAMFSFENITLECLYHVMNKDVSWREQW